MSHRFYGFPSHEFLRRTLLVVSNKDVSRRYRCVFGKDKGSETWQSRRTLCGRHRNKESSSGVSVRFRRDRVPCNCNNVLQDGDVSGYTMGDWCTPVTSIFQKWLKLTPSFSLWSKVITLLNRQLTWKKDYVKLDKCLFYKKWLLRYRCDSTKHSHFMCNLKFSNSVLVFFLPFTEELLET